MKIILFTLFKFNCNTVSELIIQKYVWVRFFPEFFNSLPLNSIIFLDSAINQWLITQLEFFLGEFLQWGMLFNNFIKIIKTSVKYGIYIIYVLIQVLKVKAIKIFKKTFLIKNLE